MFYLCKTISRSTIVSTRPTSWFKYRIVKICVFIAWFQFASKAVSLLFGTTETCLLMCILTVCVASTQCWLLASAWTNPCSFLGNIFKSSLSLPSFMAEREWPSLPASFVSKVGLEFSWFLAWCLNQYFKLALYLILNKYNKRNWPKRISQSFYALIYIRNSSSFFISAL